MLDTTEEAMEYLKQMHGEADSQPAETASDKSADIPTGEDTDGQQVSPAPEATEEVVRETTEPEPAETVTEKATPKKKPSKQEKIDHAFSRERQRHKAEMAEKDKRIKELEEKISKYSQLEQGDFDPNDIRSYVDHKIALNDETKELDRLKRERSQMANDEQMREASERHEQQVNACFNDDEKEHYWALLRNGGQKFREFLNEYDDGTIDQYIGDSEIAPVLISALMRNPDILKSIVEKRNPMRKAMELQKLESRLLLARKVGSVARKSEGTTKQPLPIVGSQVAAPGVSATTSKRDWNRYLEEHPY